LKTNANLLYGVYLDSIYLNLIENKEIAYHLAMSYDLKYTEDRKRLNKNHRIHTFNKGELCINNGIIFYTCNMEELEVIKVFNDIKWS
jgi:hypothetical protein